MSNKLMKTKKTTSKTIERKQNVRLDHINHTVQVTQAALNANAEIYRAGFSNLCSGVNEAEFLMEAIRVRYGANKVMEEMEAAYQNWVKRYDIQ